MPARRLCDRARYLHESWRERPHGVGIEAVSPGKNPSVGKRSTRAGQRWGQRDGSINLVFWARQRHRRSARGEDVPCASHGRELDESVLGATGPGCHPGAVRRPGQAPGHSRHRAGTAQASATVPPLRGRSMDIPAWPYRFRTAPVRRDHMPWHDSHSGLFPAAARPGHPGRATSLGMALALCPPVPDTNAPRVLVIDDDPVNRDSVQALLASGLRATWFFGSAP